MAQLYFLPTASQFQVGMYLHDKNQCIKSCLLISYQHIVLPDVKSTAHTEEGWTQNKLGSLKQWYGMQSPSLPRGLFPWSMEISLQLNLLLKDTFLLLKQNYYNI